MYAKFIINRLKAAPVTNSRCIAIRCSMLPRMPSTPPVRLASVVTLPSSESRALERALLELAGMAARGEITGVAYTALERGGGTREVLLGRANTDVHRAHYGASRLCRVLLWPEEFD